VDKRALVEETKAQSAVKTRGERPLKKLYVVLIDAHYRLNDLSITGG